MQSATTHICATRDSAEDPPKRFSTASLSNHAQLVLISIHTLHGPDHSELLSVKKISISQLSVREVTQAAKAALCINLCFSYHLLSFEFSSQIPQVPRNPKWQHKTIGTSILHSTATQEYPWRPFWLSPARTAMLLFNDNQDCKREEGKWCTNKFIPTFSHLGNSMQI